MTKKFSMAKVVEQVEASLKGDKTAKEGEIGTGASLVKTSTDPKDFVVMPDWYEKAYGVLGIQFSRGFVQMVGDSDTGKTSFCITAMRAAQEQGYGIVYVETEGKTTEKDLLAWGVDPKQVFIVRTNMTEKAFDRSFRSIDSFFSLYPRDKLLYIFDSLGNTVSRHDKGLDILKKNQKVGGAAKTNRLGLGRLVAYQEDHPIAVLIVNYDYANMGTHGNTQAGGKALKFYTMVGIKASRVGDWTKVVNKEKLKVGINAKWTTFKDQYSKSIERLLPVDVFLKISHEGIEQGTAPKEKEE